MGSSTKQTQVSTARVFWSGRSQAVRLPKEYRFAGSVVSIHREGQRVILEPHAVELDENGWPRGFWDEMPTVGPDFDLGDRARTPERPDPLGHGKPR
jgi:antitoxin VapB